MGKADLQLLARVEDKAGQVEPPMSFHLSGTEELLKAIDEERKSAAQAAVPAD